MYNLKDFGKQRKNHETEKQRTEKLAHYRKLRRLKKKEKKKAQKITRRK